MENKETAQFAPYQATESSDRSSQAEARGSAPESGTAQVVATLDFETEKVHHGDHIVRGTAADGMIRALAITARNTVQTAKDNHHASPLVTAALGRLMMGAQMMGVMFKGPDELITLTVRGDGPIDGLTVTANTKGQVKGFANHHNVWLAPNAQGHLDVGGGIGAGTLTVVRDQPGIEPYSSAVELVSGEIGDDFARYFALSDQVPTSLGVGVLVDRDTSVRQAGGFILQMMPGYYDYLVDELEHNLQGITSVTDLLQQGMTPTEMLQYLLRGLDYREMETTPAEFYCGCNEARAARAVLALGPAELRDMIDKQEQAEVYCHFCGKRHYLSVAQLQELLDRAS